MFLHLRLHTEFSVVDGTNRIDEVVAAAAADCQPALAITDLSNLFCSVRSSFTRPRAAWVSNPSSAPR
jgi:DNA polymerase-3 subunit alpha